MSQVLICTFQPAMLNSPCSVSFHFNYWILMCYCMLAAVLRKRKITGHEISSVLLILNKLNVGTYYYLDDVS